MELSGLMEFTFLRGRVALYAILKGIGVGRGDSVALQAFTCIAVPEAIIATGARPIYVDIEPLSVNMDANDLLRKIDSRTRAIIVQHTFGIPADMDRIVGVAEKAGIPIIEDCCHTINSTYKGKEIGSFGIGSFYSYEWGKPVVIGIGGSAVVNDFHIYKKINELYDSLKSPPLIRQYRLWLQYFIFNIFYRPSIYWPMRSLYHRLASFGTAESNYNPIQKDENKSIDFSLRMSKNHKKFLLKKLNELNNRNDYSRWVVSEYKKKINSNSVTEVNLPSDCDIIFARYPYIAKDKMELIEKAHKNKVELSEWYSTPVHPIKENEWHIINYESGSCPNAEKMAKYIVTLPTHLKVGKRDIERIIQLLNER